MWRNILKLIENFFSRRNKGSNIGNGNVFKRKMGKRKTKKEGVCVMKGYTNRLVWMKKIQELSWVEVED